MPAYARLRRNGLQPRTIDGCAELETRASTKAEVEMGQLFSRDELPRVHEGMAMAAELGVGA